MRAYEEFKDKYYWKIMKLVTEQHQNQNMVGIHGHSHIARCIILTKILCEIHNVSEEQAMICFITIGLHDVAREDDGWDLWEEESGNKAKAFALENGFNLAFASECFNIITEKTSQVQHRVGHIICHDADCLDIIRCTLLDNFDENYLITGKHNPAMIGLRQRLILETSSLISQTYTNQLYEEERSLIDIEEVIKTDHTLEIFNKYLFK